MKNTFIFLAILSATVRCSSAMACPTCKSSLHDNGVAIGYGISILFMMGMPMLIASFWGVMIYRFRKQMRAA